MPTISGIMGVLINDLVIKHQAQLTKPSINNIEICTGVRMEKGSLQGKGKLFIAYALAGIVFGVSASFITTGLAGIFSVGFDSDLTTVFSMLFNLTEPMGILFAVISLLLIGVLVWIFGYIGQYIRAKITSMKNVKLSKRPHLLSFVFAGVITIGVLSLFNAVLAGVSPDANLTDINVFLGAWTTNPLLGIASLIAYSALGFIVILLGSKGIKLAEDYTPDKAKVI